ncbi:hypothetical protein PC119_g5654 [Phytophthora cactorum]|nr:hypothetical protein PC119_g5654 [Phytophthora cactorum]
MKRKSRGDESEDSREESSGGSERASPPHAGDVCSDGDDEEEADPQVARDSGRGSDGDDSLNDLAGEDESLKEPPVDGIRPSSTITPFGLLSTIHSTAHP